MALARTCRLFCRESGKERVNKPQPRIRKAMTWVPNIKGTRIGRNAENKVVRMRRDGSAL